MSKRAILRISHFLQITYKECHHRKLRCLQFSDKNYGTGIPCVRCTKLGITCVFLPPKKVGRKASTANDQRISEIERKVEALKDAVQQTQVLSSSAWGLPPELSNQTWSGQLENTPKQQKQDHDIVPMEEEYFTDQLAEPLYVAFSTRLAPMVPVVACPNEIPWEVISLRRPAFSRAAATAAAVCFKSNHAEKLFSFTERYLIDQAIIKGHKSLDLIQGLLILSLWHLPPKVIQEFKFSQFAHMAATMIQDLWCSNDPEFIIPPSEVETARTYLACYLCCSK